MSQGETNVEEHQAVSEEAKTSVKSCRRGIYISVSALGAHQPQ